MEADGRDYSQVQAGDVVLLPVFGSTSQEVEMIRQKGAGVITTVCPLVSGQSTSKGCCSVIHGSREDHQMDPEGNYIFVRNLEEAQYLGNYILCGGDSIGFAKKFQGATSDDFDANSMLDTIVFNCQTRCAHAKKETGEIGDLLRAAMIEKYGIDRMDDHFISFDGIGDMVSSFVRFSSFTTLTNSSPIYALHNSALLCNIRRTKTSMIRNTPVEFNSYAHSIFLVALVSHMIQSTCRRMGMHHIPSASDITYI